MWVDSHCHLNHERFGAEVSPESLINHAIEAGVEAMVNISCQIRGDFPQVLATAQRFEHVWCSVGTHPHDAGNPAEQLVSEKELCAVARSDPKIIGIGESGLDYYYEHAPREEQQASFRKHIRACLETGLPLVVHSRDAEEDTIRILREESAGKMLTGVMHCFSSGPKLAEEALDFGFYLSFSGIVTFKKASELQNIAKNTPLERMLVETDAPFLAPEPHRGKMNEPAYVTRTGAFLAALKGLPEDQMAAATTQNFYQLFNRAKR